MPKVIAYQIEVNGVQTSIRNQDDLTAAVKETTKAYKQADFGSEKFRESEKELAQLRTLQAKFRQDVRDTARDQEISADKGKGSYRALNAELVNLRRRYKELTAAERETIGPELLGRIQKLDTELKAIDADIGQFQRNVGNYAGGIKEAFAQLGGLDLASLATVPGAVLAIGSAAIDTAKYVAEFTEEFRVLRGEIQNLTGATGADLDEFATRISAIGETFNESTTDILNAANSVSKQLDISFSEALDRIEEGFIAGSNQTGEFLDNLREYPTFFREAGLSADQFFRVINQQATQGLFSDKGVDTVKEVTLRLRELTQPTIDALEGIGLKSEDIRKQIENEGIGAAIATVAQRLSELEADSPQIGAALADIFGGPGEDAGIAFVTSLKDINSETQSLIDLSNEYQVQQARTLQINREFAEVQNDIAKEVGGVGAEFSNLGTIIETKALRVLLFVIEQFKFLTGIFKPLVDAFVPLLRSLGLFNEEASLAENIAGLLAKGFRIVTIPIQAVVELIAKFVNGLTDAVQAGRGFLEWIGIVDKKGPDVSDKVKGMSGSMGRFGGSVKRTTEEQKKQTKETDELTKKLENLKKKTDTAAVATDKFAKGSIAALRKEVQDLKKELDEAAPENADGVLQRLIGAEKALDDLENARTELRNRLTSTRREIEPLQLLPTPDQAVKQAEAYTDSFLEVKKRMNERIIKDEIDLAAALQEIQTGIFTGINDVLSSLTETSNIRQESEIAALEARYEREIELAEGNETRQAQLEEELDRQRQQIQQREFNRQKQYRRAAALASLAEGVINILSAPTTIPDPFGALYKAVRIGILTATTGQQISNINAQSIGERGLIVELARGGILHGATHQDPGGGIPLTLNGRPVLAEHGEAFDTDEFGAVAVINKRSTTRYRRQLERVRGRIFPGKRKYLSDINSARNYGIAFAAEGAILQPEVASVISGTSGGTTVGVGSLRIEDDSINQIAARTAAAVRVGAREGVSAGMTDENKRQEREARLSQRTGI